MKSIPVAALYLLALGSICGETSEIFIPGGPCILHGEVADQ